MPDRRRTARTRTPAELDAEAVITPRDEVVADLAAERLGSPLFRAMLDATPDDQRPPGGG